VEHIYAAGDVIGPPALAATGMEQARWAVTHAFGITFKAELASLQPTGIYTIPEASMVGETEESLRAKGESYVVGKALYRENGRGTIIGDRHGFLKLLFRRRDLKLLGVHVLGEQASEVVHVGLVALLVDGGFDLFNRIAFNYPTLGVLYQRAAYEAAIAARADGMDITARPNAQQ
jgi:NAD(P) transhydrogenase